MSGTRGPAVAGTGAQGGRASDDQRHAGGARRRARALAEMRAGEGMGGVDERVDALRRRASARGPSAPPKPPTRSAQAGSAGVAGAAGERERDADARPGGEPLGEVAGLGGAAEDQDVQVGHAGI